MKSLRVQLTETQVQALVQMAAEGDTTVAHLVRQAVEAWLQAAASNRAERKRRAITMAGRFNSGHADVSIAHDRHLDDAFAE